MEQPRVQYATTTDGVRVAFSTSGLGRPLIFLVGPGAASHVEAGITFSHPRLREQRKRLSRGRMLVGMDLRGQGLSAHGVTDFSLDGFLRDVEAVVARMGADRIDLMALRFAAPIAIAYAARNPERVAHLILWHAAAKFDHSPLDGLSPALKLLLDSDWVTFTEVYAHTLMGWEDGSGASGLATLMRESSTAEGVKAHLEAVGAFDVSAELASVACPTLVLHRRGVPGRGQASAVAASIPDARMVILEGDSITTYMGDLDALIRVVDDFLGDGAGATAAEPGSGALDRHGTAIVLFADIADSTALTERLGDAAFRAKARDLDAALRKVIRDHGGTPIEGKLLGDGVLAVFTSARQAIEAALVCGFAGSEAGLPLHLGLHAGDVLREKDAGERENVYGGAVNIASRISGLSAPGEVLVSDVVRTLARTSAGVRFEDRGEQALKGVGEAVRVWAVREGGE